MENFIHKVAAGVIVITIILLFYGFLYIIFTQFDTVANLLLLIFGCYIIGHIVYYLFKI